MKLNKKGMTLVEIIISIALISIVLVFLFSLLVDVKDMNDEASINSDYLINKALILKNIEEDLDKENSVTLNTCEINNFYTTYPTIDKINGGDYSYFKQSSDKSNSDVQKRLASECISFDFGNNDVAHLGIYYYKNKDSYVISYIHGNTKATRLLPEFDKYNVDSNGNIRAGFKIKYSKSDQTSECILNSGNNKLTDDEENIKCTFASKTLVDGKFHKIEIPIIGSDGKDYSIIISYYKKSE